MNLSLPKTYFKFLFIAVLFIGQYANAQIAAWTFDTSLVAPNTPTSVTANFGNQSGTAIIYANGTNGSSTWITATIGNELTMFAGTTVNDPRGTAVAGSSYSLVGGTGNSANGKSIVLKFSMTGFENPVLTFATRGTASGFNNHQWAWSIDNITYTNFGTNTANTGSTFLTRTLDLSSINDVDNASDVYLRLTVSGATNATGNNRLDNFVINASAVVSGPTVTTTVATAISTTGADLNGTINANGTTTDASFEYGTTTAYGDTAAATPSTVTGTSDTSIVATISSLAVNTLYYFRAVGTESAVPTNGADLTFYTLAATPGVLAISNPQFTTLDIAIDATTENGNPSATEYAIQETGGQYVQANGSLGATAVWQTAAAWATTEVTGITASTTYTFQVKARNGANVETSFGSTNSGTTLSPLTADFNIVQFPNTTQNITEGTSFTVYIRAYEDGITNLAGSSPRLKGWVGYSSTNDNPANVGWTWIPATFNVQVGNDDEYQADIPGSLSPGTYYYAARFEIDDSTVYTYGGAGGNWNNNNVTLNVNANVVDFANVQFPTTATITEGETVTVFAQVFEPGITPGAGAGAGITAEIGYSSTNTTPDGTWTWLSTTYNTDSGNNDEYQANLGAGLTPGTFYYASRFIKTGSTTYVYGGTNGVWNNDNGVLTVEALGTPVATEGTLIGQTEFTANWNAVVGATEYRLDVSTSPDFQSASSQNIFEGFTAYTNQTSFNGLTLTGTGNYTTAASSGVSGPNSLQFNDTNDRLVSPSFASAATSLSFWIRGNGTNAISALLVEGFNGSSWVTIQNITNSIPTAGTTFLYNASTTPALPTNISQFRITYTKNAGNVAFDDFDVDYNVFSPFYIIENLNVGNVTSYQVTGLDPETTYYYRVRAVLGTVTSANSNVIEVETKPTTVTWNGTAWSNVDGPDETIDAIIAGVYVTGTHGAFTSKKLTVTSGSLTISTGTSITVEDVLENELTAAEVVVENNANLVQSNDVTNIGSITVQRNSSDLMRLDYTLWSSPVVGQNLLDFSPQTMANRFYTYNPSNNQYATITPSANSFAEGTGYLIRTPDNHPTTPTAWLGSFVGEPHNGDVTVSVANNTYNAIGNPYPSTISADDFINENNLTEALYFWRKTNAAAGSAYATYTLAGGVGTGSSSSNAQVPNGTIQVGQGFIARATSSSLVFTNAMRTANQANQFFRSENENKSRVWLNLNDADNLVGQTMIAYMEGTTTEKDAKYDGKYINDSQTAFTSLINNEEFAVQARGEFVATDVVPMSIKIENAGIYSISLAQGDGLFATENDIYLRDNTTGIEHDLRNAAYSFSIDSGVFNNRFELIYQSALSVENPTFSNVLITAKNKIIEINSGNELIKEVKVFDMRGRLLAQQSNVNASYASLTLVEVANQVLIVQITSDNGKVTSRKVVH